MEQKVFHFYISIHIPSVQPEFSSVPGCTPAVSGRTFRYIGKCNFALSAVLYIIQISFAVHNLFPKDVLPSHLPETAESVL